MATVNIGNLSFTHKGDYDGSTAYSKNDVVYYSTNGNAYIAKQATTGNVPTNATYWNVFAQGSGGIWNAGLSLGSAGQVVKVNSGASALEFGTVSSDYVKIGTATLGSDAATLSIDGFFDAAYRRYDIEWQIQTDNSSSSNHLAMRFNTGGSANSGAYYTYGFMHHGNNNSGGFHDARANLGNSSWGKQSMFRLSNTWQEHQLGSALANRGIMNLYSPQSSSMWKQCTWTNSIGSDNSSWTAGGTGHAIWHDATALTGVSFILQNGGNLKTGSTAIMYGVK